MTRPARSVALLGPDVIVLAMEKRATGRDGGNAVLAIEVGAAIDAGRLERALATFVASYPWIGGRLRRPLPWGRLCWRAPRGAPTPPPVRRLATAPGGIGALVDGELAAAIDPRRAPPLRFTIVADPPHLVVTWSHALMDPQGSEHLVRLLAALDESPAALRAPAPLVVAPPDTRSLRERGALASRGAAHLRGVATDAPRSLARTRDATATKRHWRFRFAAGPPPADRLRRGMPWRLAVVAKAMTALYERRGVPTDVPFLVPVSVDRRARGEHGPVLGNYLSFHFACFPPPVDGDVAGLARRIRDRLADAVRRDELEATAAGMDFARYRPLRGMFRELPWAAAGDFCSFHFADTDALLPDRTHVFGAPVVGGYHVAAVPQRPGAGVFFTRRAGVESLVVSGAGSTLDDHDAETIADIVEREMEWTRI